MHLSINRLTLCALLAFALSLAPAAARTPAPDVTCTACLLIDDTGRELFARDASELLPNASTTKMTTALVVRKHADLEGSVRVSPTAAATGGGGLDLRTGEIFSVEVLLYALLLDSSNDAAVALAEHVAGSEEAFVHLMNRSVARLGAVDTHYVTAHGLDTPGHGSSARDLALIADRVLDDPVLAEVVGSPSARIASPRGVVTLENRNLLLESYRGAIGVKTGFTAEAGNVLVAAAERHGRRLIAVVMHSVDAAADSRVLLDHGWAELANTVILRKGTQVGAVVFDEGSTEVVVAGSVRDSFAADEISFRFTPREPLPMPVAAGDVVGEVLITARGKRVQTVDAVAAGSVPATDRSWMSDVFVEVLGAFGRAVTVQW